LSWTVVRIFSVTAAIMTSVAVVIAPVAAVMIANAGDEQSRWLQAPQAGAAGRGKAGIVIRADACRLESTAV